MLLLTSSLILSQSTNIQNINDIYKGLKQNGYLKLRLSKVESTLNSANALIVEQDKAINSAKDLIASKDATINNLQYIQKKEAEICEEQQNRLKIDIAGLKEDIRFEKEMSKINQKKKFWTGVKIGGFSVAVLGVVALVAMNQ